MKTIQEMISTGFTMGASDIHVSVDHPPIYRINNRLISLPDDACLGDQETRYIGRELLVRRGITHVLEEVGQVDFALSFPDMGRVRVNLYVESGRWAMAIRIIPAQIPGFKELGLPPIVHELSLQDKGLILVTGTSGSGKSTTLAAIINLLNHTEERHIITLEDPIEFRHRSGTCLVHQREIGSDTGTFASGLRAALRQDPDLIMVGEIRDLETIAIAMTAAETGHLVLASLHAGSSVQTLERIIGSFPAAQQAQVRIQLAGSLLGIISQQLIPNQERDGRALAAEILVMNQAIRNLIRENKIHQVLSVIQTGSSTGMISMDKALQVLERRSIISTCEMSKRLLCEK